MFCGKSVTFWCGKVAGAVGLAVISAPFCAAGIGVGGEIAAGIVSASGGGDIAQGIYEIAYGWNGDSESTSFNLVRDTLYSGNEKAYHVSTGTAAACGQVGQGIAAMEAAKKAAEKELAEQMAKEAAKESKEVVEEVVKKNADDVIEEAVGQNADDILEETEKLYDDIFDQYYKEQFDPIGEKAIAQPDSVGYKSGSNTHVPSANTQVVRHPEIKSPNQVKMSDVTNYWDDYLGSNLSITLKFCTFFTPKKCTGTTDVSLRVNHLFPLNDNFHQLFLQL